MEIRSAAGLRACALSRNDPALFDALVGEYGDIVELAVREVLSGTDFKVYPKLRELAWRAGEKDSLPQDLIAVHLSALSILVRTKPHAMVRTGIRQSRMLLVKMIGELALYYRSCSIGQG